MNTFTPILSTFEQTAFDVSLITKDIYWKNQRDLSGGTAYYSDSVTDYYWTLVLCKSISTKKELVNLIAESDDLFKALKKKYSFYLYPTNRKIGISVWLQEAGF